MGKANARNAGMLSELSEWLRERLEGTPDMVGKPNLASGSSNFRSTWLMGVDAWTCPEDSVGMDRFGEALRYAAWIASSGVRQKYVVKRTAKSSPGKNL